MNIFPHFNILQQWVSQAGKPMGRIQTSPFLGQKVLFYNLNFNALEGCTNSPVYHCSHHLLESHTQMIHTFSLLAKLFIPNVIFSSYIFFHSMTRPYFT